MKRIASALIVPGLLTALILVTPAASASDISLLKILVKGNDLFGSTRLLRTLNKFLAQCRGRA